MDYFRDYDALVAWLENRATLYTEGGPYKKHQQVEWQVAKKLRAIKVLVVEEKWDELTELINGGVR